jgi:hypothetical protein
MSRFNLQVGVFVVVVRGGLIRWCSKAWQRDAASQVSTVVVCARALQHKAGKVLGALINDASHVLVCLYLANGHRWVTEVFKSERTTNGGAYLVDIELYDNDNFDGGEYDLVDTYTPHKAAIKALATLTQVLSAGWDDSKDIYRERAHNCQHYADAVVEHFTGSPKATVTLLAKIEHGVVAGGRGALTSLSQTVLISTTTTTTTWEFAGEILHQASNSVSQSGFLEVLKTLPADQAAKSMAKANIGFSIILGAAFVGYDGIQLARGRTTKVAFFRNMAKQVGSTGGSTSGMYAGAALGSFLWPGIGTAIGSFVGGVAGAVVGSKAMSKVL